MIPLLPELITKTLTLANDTHPRVRYTAVRCLVSFVKHLGCTQASENGEDCDEVNDDDTGGGNGEANKHTQNMFRQAFNTIVGEHYVPSLSKIKRSRVSFTLQYTLVVCIMIQISVLQCFANLGKGQIAISRS